MHSPSSCFFSLAASAAASAASRLACFLDALVARQPCLPPYCLCGPLPSSYAFLVASSVLSPLAFTGFIQGCCSCLPLHMGSACATACSHAPHADPVSQFVP
jgi:hypothetical protein